MLLIAMYVQGCFNQVVYWPTYTWSFLHVVLAGLFITLWVEIRNGNIAHALPSRYAEWEEEDALTPEEFQDFAASTSVT